MNKATLGTDEVLTLPEPHLTYLREAHANLTAANAAFLWVQSVISRSLSLPDGARIDMAAGTITLPSREQAPFPSEGHANGSFPQALQPSGTGG